MKIANVKGRAAVVVAEGKAVGDTTTLADPSVMAKLKGQYETAEG